MFYGQFGMNYNNSTGRDRKSSSQMEIDSTFWALHKMDNTVWVKPLKDSIHRNFPIEYVEKVRIADG